LSNQVPGGSIQVPSFTQISDICEAYGIGSLIKVLKRIEDTSNINIIILTGKGKYVIKLFTCDSERFDFIMDTLKKFRLKKLPVLTPVKNKSGEYFIEAGTGILQITKFVFGYPFKFSVNQAKYSGKMLFRFHDALTDTENFVRPIASLYPSTPIMLDGISRLKKMDEEISREQIDSIIELYDKIVDKWEMDEPDLPETIIHGDWKQKNLIFNENDDICCIMDFEFMTKAERIFDIAYALWHLKITKGNMDVAKAFMQGYGRLTKDEIHYLPLEICRIVYYYICTSTLSLNPKYELDNHFKSHYPFIKWVLSKEGQSTIQGLCVE
jgi:Ser/Thr protein kinase RdoA (MazF antagonist)